MLPEHVSIQPFPVHIINFLGNTYKVAKLLEKLKRIPHSKRSEKWRRRLHRRIDDETFLALDTSAQRIKEKT